MTENLYKTPESDLTEDMPTSKRPIGITIICILGVIGAVATVFLIFSGTAQAVGTWYTVFLGVSALIGLACFYGFWKMKKKAVYAYIVFFACNQVILLATNIWKPQALLIPGVFIIILLYYSRQMQ